MQSVAFCRDIVTVPLYVYVAFLPTVGHSNLLVKSSDQMMEPPLFWACVDTAVRSSRNTDVVIVLKYFMGKLFIFCVNLLFKENFLNMTLFK